MAKQDKILVGFVARKLEETLTLVDDELYFHGKCRFMTMDQFAGCKEEATACHRNLTRKMHILRRKLRRIIDIVKKDQKCPDEVVMNQLTIEFSRTMAETNSFYSVLSTTMDAKVAKQKLEQLKKVCREPAGDVSLTSQ